MQRTCAGLMRAAKAAVCRHARHHISPHPLLFCLTRRTERENMLRSAYLAAPSLYPREAAPAIAGSQSLRRCHFVSARRGFMCSHQQRMRSRTMTRTTITTAARTDSTNALAIHTMPRRGVYLHPSGDWCGGARWALYGNSVFAPQGFVRWRLRSLRLGPFRGMAG